MLSDKTWGKEEFDKAIGHYGMINEPDENAGTEETKRKVENELNRGSDKE